jgi:very-short-patch-repair endonuclease
VRSHVIDAHIASYALTHHGLVRARDLQAAGVDPAAIRRRAATGRLTRVDRDLYRVPSSPVTWEQRALRWCWTAGNGAVLSHRASAMLWDLDGFDAAPFEVTTPRWLRPARRTGVIVHESTDLADIDRTTRCGIPCTTPVRTLLDLAAVASPRKLDAAIDDALRRRLCTVEALIDRFVQLARPGKRGFKRLRPLLERRAGGEVPTQSRFEFALLPLIRTAGLPDPVRQHAVGLDDTTVYLDFAWPELMLAGECDGLVGHLRRLPWDDDRQNQLVLAGWLVLRFTWRQLIDAPDQIVAQLAEAHRRRLADRRAG